MDRHDDYYAYRTTTDGDDEPVGCELGGFKALVIILAVVELIWRFFN